MNSRASVLRAALRFLSLDSRESELCLLHPCFDNWRGIGEIVAGMARQDYDLELRRYDVEQRCGRQETLSCRPTA
jgi:hypothetical protein